MAHYMLSLVVCWTQMAMASEILILSITSEFEFFDFSKELGSPVSAESWEVAGYETIPSWHTDKGVC